MLKRFFALASILLAVIAASADEWNKDFAVSGTPEVRVTTKDGAVTFKTWDRKQVSAHVTTEGWRISDDQVRITPRQNGDSIELDVYVPSGSWFNFGINNRNVRIDLLLPHESNLDLHTGDGSITGQGAHGNFNLKTGDGSMDLDRLDGKLVARSGDGGIHVRGRFDVLDISTGDGSIHAEAQDGSKMAGSWSAHSGDGSIELRLPQNFAADVEARTGDGSLDFEMPVQVSGQINHHSLHGKLNGGGPTLELRSGDGSIHVMKN